MSPTDYDADNNDIPEFDETLIKGPGDPTEETNFSGALNMATDLLSELPEDERRSIFLISDGHFANSKGDLAYAEKENIFVTVFAVGHDAKTCRGAPLQTIVETTGGTCIEVTDIQSAVDSYFNGTNLDSQLKFD